MLIKSVLVALGLALGGCALNSQYTPVQSSAGGVQMLFEYPKADYKPLGVFTYDFYKPGFSEPTINDVMPQIEAKVLSVGGNAFIVRDQVVPAIFNRSIKVTCEVIRIN